VEELKDTINQMIANLKETTLRNQEQDWLKSNLAKFTQMLAGTERSEYGNKSILSELGTGGKCTLRYVLHFEQDEEHRIKNLNCLLPMHINQRKIFRKNLHW
jgi:hypothetical protein